MTWTCDKEDDCENGEDETHCSVSGRVGRARVSGAVAWGGKSRHSRGGSRNLSSLQDPLAKSQIPDSSSLWSYSTSTDLTVTKTNVLACFFAQQMHVSVVTLRVPSYSSFE